jgi:hypothetical protein
MSFDEPTPSPKRSSATRLGTSGQKRQKEWSRIILIRRVITFGYYYFCENNKINCTKAQKSLAKTKYMY